MEITRCWSSSRALVELQPCLKNMDTRAAPLIFHMVKIVFNLPTKRSPLDINSDAGLVPLVCTRKTNCLIIFEGLNLFSIFIVTEYTHIITGQIHPAAAACVAARWTRNMGVFLSS